MFFGTFLHITFTHIAASNGASDDVTNKVTDKE